MSIEELIRHLPEIIIYFVPGYIYLGIFCFLTSKKIKEIENLFIRSVVISFFFVVIANNICELTKLDIKYSIYFALSISIIIALTSVKVYYSKIYKRLFCKIANVSGHSSIWEDLIDRTKGANIRGFIKYRNHDAEIRGTVRYYEILDNGDCNIALWNYTITSDEFVLKPKEDINKLFFINSKDIEGLEFFKGK